MTEQFKFPTIKSKNRSWIRFLLFNPGGGAPEKKAGLGNTGISMAMTKGIMGLVYTAYSWEEGIKPLAEKPGVLWKQHQTLLPLSLSHQSRLHFLTKSIQQQKNNVAK